MIQFVNILKNSEHRFSWQKNYFHDRIIFELLCFHWWLVAEGNLFSGSPWDRPSVRDHIPIVCKHDIWQTACGNLQLSCRWRQRWTDWILRSEGQRSRSRSWRDQISSKKRFGNIERKPVSEGRPFLNDQTRSKLNSPKKFISSRLVNCEVLRTSWNVKIRPQTI